MGERGGADQGQEKAGLGFGHLSMNEVPPSARMAEEEVPRQRSRTGLSVVLVILAVAAVGFGVRMIANVAPGQEAEDSLRRELEALPAWQKGDLMGAQYVTGNTVRLEFPTRLRTANDADREAMRQAARSVFDILRKQRPDRDLYIDGYQEGEQVVRGEYRYKSSLPAREGEQVLDVSIHVRGDAEGGMQQAYGTATRGRR